MALDLRPARRSLRLVPTMVSTAEQVSGDPDQGLHRGRGSSISGNQGSQLGSALGWPQSQ